MSIRVKHDPSAATMGDIAFDIGKGQRQERLSDKANQLFMQIQQLNLAKKQADRSYELANRRQDLDETQVRNQNTFRQASLDENARQFDVQTQMQLDKPAQMLQIGLQHQKLLQDNIRWEYSEQQRREQEKITAAISGIRQGYQNGQYTAKEAHDLEKQMWEKYYGIVPMPRYKDEPDPIDLFRQRAIYDEQGNYTGKYIDEKGNVRLDPMIEKASKENIAKLEVLAKDREAKAKMHIELSRYTNPVTGEPLYDYKQRQQIIKEAFGETAQVGTDATMPAQSIPVELQSIWGKLSQRQRAEALQRIEDGDNAAEIYSDLVQGKSVKTPTLFDIEAELRRRGVKL
jgi:hypothetical protein